MSLRFHPPCQQPRLVAQVNEVHAVQAVVLQLRPSPSHPWVHFVVALPGSLDGGLAVSLSDPTIHLPPEAAHLKVAPAVGSELDDLGARQASTTKPLPPPGKRVVTRGFYPGGPAPAPVGDRQKSACPSERPQVSRWGCATRPWLGVQWPWTWLVVESVIPPGKEPLFGKLLDLAMLVIPGGGRLPEAERGRRIPPDPDRADAGRGWGDRGEQGIIDGAIR